MRKVVLAVALLIGTSQAASAQSIEDRLRDQLRQTTLQLREAQDAQATLQAQKAAAEQERDALKKQVAELQGEVAHAKHGGNEAQVLQQEVGRYKDQLAQATDAAKSAQADHDKLQGAVVGEAALLEACQQKNAQLITVANQILDTFERVDLNDVIGLNEPFVQSARVKLENMSQDFGDRIYDGKFDPRTVKMPKPAPQQPQQQTTPPATPAAKSTDGVK